MTFNFYSKVKFLFFVGFFSVTTCVRTVTFFVFICGLLIFVMWIDLLKMMCHIPWIEVNDLELQPQGQIPVFSLTNSYPTCNFFCLLMWAFDILHVGRSPESNSYTTIYGLITIARPTEMDSI